MKFSMVLAVVVFLAVTIFGLPDLSAGDAGSIVAGFVIDDATSQAIKYANIQVIGTSLGDAVLCDNGSFMIRRVPPGEREVVAAMLGYERGQVRVELEPGEMKLLVFRLKKSE